jgi:hypothetical protein
MKLFLVEHRSHLNDYLRLCYLMNLVSILIEILLLNASFVQIFQPRSDGSEVWATEYRVAAGTKSIFGPTAEPSVGISGFFSRKTKYSRFLKALCQV